jgi:hypothetical protein
MQQLAVDCFDSTIQGVLVAAAKLAQGEGKDSSGSWSQPGVVLAGTQSHAILVFCLFIASTQCPSVSYSRPSFSYPPFVFYSTTLVSLTSFGQKQRVSGQDQTG